MLEGTSYFQGTTTVDEYVDNFCNLTTLSGLNVEPVLYSINPTDPTIRARMVDAKHVGQMVVLKFRRGLRPAIERKVAEAEAHPEDWDVQGWYDLAKRFERHEREDAAFRGTQRATSSAPQTRPAFPAQVPAPQCTLFPAQAPTSAPFSRTAPFAPRPAAAAPPPVPVVPDPAFAPLHSGIPMEVDATRQRFLAQQRCYTCGQPGHLAITCPNCQREHLCVADMTTEDWAEIAQVYSLLQDSQEMEANQVEPKEVERSMEGFQENQE